MIEKPKKERRFLKILGKVGEILVQELLIKVGKSLVQKIGGKKNLPSIIFLSLFYNIAFASIDSIPYPITPNKQRLGWQTTGNGLVYRGRASDTITKPSNYANKDIKAYMLVDTVNNVMYSYIASKGGWKFNNSDTVIIQGATMPFDSITLNTAKNGTVGVGEVEYNDTQGSLIQGLKGGNVTNVIGQQLHQRVNNRTGAPLAKGDVVYLSGSQGNRITVAKGLAVTDAFSANTFGVVAENIANNASGFIITEGLITGLNTSALTEDSAVYLSPTVAGALTSTKPQAPQHSVYIGVCVKSNNGSGELFVKIRNGQELDELHDVQITSPVNNASLYYKSSEGLWRDTTAALLVSDTAAMLTPYFRDADTSLLNLTSRFAAKLNLSDTASMLSNYLRTGVAANTYLPLTGGTLTGSLDVNTNNGGNNFQDSTLKVTYNQSSFGVNQNITGIYSSVNTTGYTSTGILSEASTIYSTAIGVKGKATQSDINGPGVAYGVIGEIAASGSGSNGSTYAGYFNNTSTVGGNNYGLFVNTASGGDYGIYQTGTGVNYLGSNTSMGGTLGVTGATTLSNLAGTGTRMVVAASDGLLSTQALGVSTFSAGTTGFTPSIATSGAITLGGTLAIANGGTGATSAANARTNLGATTRGANTFLLTDIGAISFLRYNADNTVSQRAADGMRTDLGGTTIGQSMFTLTNPSAITFPRFNADNTVSALDAATFRTAIGAGTGNGNGTVTNVTGTLPISVANGTTTPSITIANASTTASGVVTTGTQSMAGNKTFTGDLATSGAFSATGFSTLTGGASVGTMATTTSITHILGVNSSNAIGEIALGSGLSFSSGTLSVTGTGTFTTTNSNYTVTSSDTYIAFNNNFSNITVTLPSASGNTGRQLYFRNVAAGSIISASNNVINNTVTTGTPDNSILGAGNTNYKWCTLVSDGTYWIKMQAN